MNTVFIVSLESIETRYTIDWAWFIPNRVSEYIEEEKLDYRVIDIVGDINDVGTSDGAFLNFADTNIWKNQQLNKIAEMFKNNEIEPGDKFIFTDAWNPAIIQLRYISSLLDVPVEVHSIWHAGSYDPWDFLGRKFDKSWSYDFEKSLFFASDKNYFATNYHADLFRRKLGINYENYFLDKGIVCGFPFDYLKDKIKYDGREKKDLILFPHRISEEKQPEIFEDLAKSLPQYEFNVCQKNRLTKEEYYNLLLDSKIVFSANLQETLGISMYEGYLAQSIPMVPDRLSYQEIYSPECMYLSSWTESYAQYLRNKEHVLGLIKSTMTRYNEINDAIQSDQWLNNSLNDYFSINSMLKHIFDAN